MLICMEEKIIPCNRKWQIFQSFIKISLFCLLWMIIPAALSSFILQKNHDIWTWAPTSLTINIFLLCFRSAWTLKKCFKKWSSVSIGYGLDNQSLITGQGLFLFANASRLPLGPIQPPILCIPGALSSGVKWQEHKAGSFTSIKRRD
jgi:hypothetical protein